MHELSVAMNIVEIVQEEAESRGVQVRAVHLKLGALSGVVKDSLQFCYEMACAETPLKNSQLLIEEIPVMVFCANCQARQPLESIQLFCCPKCGAPTSTVVQGKELEVVALEIQE